MRANATLAIAGLAYVVAWFLPSVYLPDLKALAGG